MNRSSNPTNVTAWSQDSQLVTSSLVSDSLILYGVLFVLCKQGFREQWPASHAKHLRIKHFCLPFIVVLRVSRHGSTRKEIVVKGLTEAVSPVRIRSTPISFVLFRSSVCLNCVNALSLCHGLVGCSFVAFNQLVHNRLGGLFFMTSLVLKIYHGVS